jgi:serine/threonine protein kinase
MYGSDFQIFDIRLTSAAKCRESEESISNGILLVSIVVYRHLQQLIIRYMFMELAPGGDLMSFVTAHGGHLSDLYARVIVRQVVIAVNYLHSNGIVHRDLKPDNILVMHTGIGHRVVVTDFGCASILHAGGRMASQVGTRDYLAPCVISFYSISQY